LFELYEIFGGEDVKLHDEDIVLEDNSINMENEECIPELARKQKCSSGRNENVQKKNQKEDLNNDVASEKCDVKPDENVMFWDNNDDTSISNKTEDIEEITLEINPDDQVDFDMFLEEQFNEDHHFAEVINDDKEEMHEVRLLRLLEEYENEKIKTKPFQLKWKLLLNYCQCFGNWLQVFNCIQKL